MADPSPTVEFAPFGNNQSREAIAARKQLAPELQLALFDVIDDLCEDPQRYPNRTRPISRDGNVRVYTHPDPRLEITFEIDEKERELYFMHYAAPAIKMRNKVFISYSHADKEWLEKLKKWLKPIEQSGLMECWDDSEIKPGADWRQEIQVALSSAKLAILLVSQNFLTSDFISSEELAPLLESAEKEGVSILWIAVSESTYEDTPLAKFQAVIDPGVPLDMLEPGDLNRKFKEIFQKIKETAQLT